MAKELAQFTLPYVAEAMGVTLPFTMQDTPFLQSLRARRIIPEESKQEDIPPHEQQVDPLSQEAVARRSAETGRVRAADEQREEDERLEQVDETTPLLNPDDVHPLLLDDEMRQRRVDAMVDAQPEQIRQDNLFREYARELVLLLLVANPETVDKVLSIGQMVYDVYQRIREAKMLVDGVRQKRDDLPYEEQLVQMMQMPIPQHCVRHTWYNPERQRIETYVICTRIDGSSERYDVL